MAFNRIRANLGDFGLDFGIESTFVCFDLFQSRETHTNTQRLALPIDGEIALHCIALNWLALASKANLAAEQTFRDPLAIHLAALASFRVSELPSSLMPAKLAYSQIMMFARNNTIQSRANRIGSAWLGSDRCQPSHDETRQDKTSSTRLNSTRQRANKRATPNGFPKPLASSLASASASALAAKHRVCTHYSVLCALCTLNTRPEAPRPKLQLCVVGRN